MAFSDFISHYISFPQVLIFFIVSTLVLIIMHLILFGISKVSCPTNNRGNKTAHAVQKEMLYQCEMYYELMFASTSILLFTGLYFLIGYRRSDFTESFLTLWDTYSDFMLLLFLFLSILLVNILDCFFIPLKEISKEEKGSLRMASMIYMLIIFGYIKFIYEDNNYDAIIVYFLIMLIGRFVYFDASFKNFVGAMRDLLYTLPCLILVLITTALMALYGFNSGYLLKDNGVVVSLWIAHLFLIIEIIPVFLLMKRNINKPSGKRKTHRGKSTDEAIDDNYDEHYPQENSHGRNFEDN